MNPINENGYTLKKIQIQILGGNNNVKSNQRGSEVNQVNGSNQHHTRGQDQKNRRNNQQLIQKHSSNFTGSDESLKVFLSPTEIRDMVQVINFKLSIITHVLANFLAPNRHSEIYQHGIKPCDKFTCVYKVIWFHQH